MRILLTGIPNDTLQNMEAVEPPFYLPQTIKPLAGSRAEVVRKTQQISNTGNYLIGEGALHALRENNVHYIEPWKISSFVKDPNFVDYVKSNFDYLAIATANMIRSDYKPSVELELLKAIDLPVFLIGVGIQRRGDLEQSIPPETLEFISEIASRDHTVFTRGVESEAFLRSQGLRNVIATGCPSIYLAPDNIKTSLARLKDLDVAECLNISLNGYLGKDLSTIADVNRLMGDARAKFHYVCQDEFLHYGLEIDPEGICFDAIKHQFVGKIDFKGKEFLKNAMSVHLFHSTSNWRTWNSKMDLSLGYRFHGNLIAMQTSTPSVIISVDDRMREMLEISGLPYIKMQDWYANDDRKAMIKQFASSFSLEKALDSYSSAHSKFTGAMVAAGIQSR